MCAAPAAEDWSNTSDGMIVTVGDQVVWDGEAQQLGIPSIDNDLAPGAKLPFSDDEEEDLSIYEEDVEDTERADAAPDPRLRVTHEIAEVYRRWPGIGILLDGAIERVELVPGYELNDEAHGETTNDGVMRLPTMLSHGRSLPSPGGRRVERSPTLQGVLRHEIGHAIEDRFERAVQQIAPGLSLARLFARQDQHRIAAGISPYAAQDRHEWFAECLAAWMCFGGDGFDIDETLLGMFDQLLRGSGRSDDATWHEEDHPRDEAGQFTTGVGGGRKAALRKREEGAALPAHISKLKIPPAWTDVHYAEDPEATVLVMGKDAKGRTTAIYSASHTAAQARAKFNRVKSLAARYDEVVKKNEKAREKPETREVADALALVMQMGIRPGSESDTGAAKKAYGATTLEGRHVVSDGSRTTLKFTGKKGVALNLPVEDRKLASMLRERAKKAGPKGQLFSVNERQLLDHMKSIAGEGFKTKDLRTRLGTDTAMRLVQEGAPPTSGASYKKAVMEVAKQVASKLGNTPAIALQSYIAPEVFTEWRLAAGV